MAFNQDYIDELNKFKDIRKKNNRRELIDVMIEDGVGNQGFIPIFKEKLKLWKLKGDGGDPANREHWFLRDMWIGRNGSLCYYSEKSQANMMHYSQQDLRNIEIQKLDPSRTARPHAFQVVRPPADGLEFETGFFAAETEELRVTWIDRWEEPASTRIFTPMFAFAVALSRPPRNSQCGTLW